MNKTEFVAAAKLLVKGQKLEAAIERFAQLEGLAPASAFAILILENIDLKESLQTRKEFEAVWPYNGAPA